MLTVGAHDGSLQADSQPKSVSSVWGLVVTWRCIHRNELSELLQRASSVHTLLWCHHCHNDGEW